MIKRKGVIAMELKENKIEFDLEELAPLLIANKTEGFRQIGEKILNALLQKDLKQTFHIRKTPRRCDHVA